MENNKIKNIIIELLNDGQSAEITAQGISMYPLLHPGDKLLIKKDNKYSSGDIIIFDRGDSFIAHRIISTTNQLIISKGDSLIKEDPAIKKSEVIGKIVARTRHGKTIPVMHWKFKMMARIMPLFHRLLAHPFAMWAIIHQKL